MHVTRVGRPSASTPNMWTHTGQRPDACKDCGKAFRSPSHSQITEAAHWRSAPGV